MHQVVEATHRGSNIKDSRHDVNAVMPAVCLHGFVLLALFIKSPGERF